MPWVMILLAILTAPLPAPARDWVCAVCGEPIDNKVYVFDDKVTGEKKDLCEKCAHLPTVCYLCGIPVKDNFKELSDGRVLCGRDVKSVVLDDNEAQRICNGAKESLDRQFSRFTTFPDGVSLRLADRVDILEMYRFPGNDFQCPVVWGYTQRQTNEGRVSYTVSVLNGLPRATLKATAAHELAHTWIWENVPPDRQKQIDHDAAEGFCELVSYLLMDAENEDSSKATIRTNAYTRGQFRLFLDAEQRFGFNEIVDWMKYGVNGGLSEDDWGRVRKVEMPAIGNATIPAIAFPGTSPQVPDKLVLKGVSGPPNRRFALINGKTFAAQEMGKVRVGQSNLVIRCLEIQTNSAVIRVEGSGEKRELFLGAD